MFFSTSLQSGRAALRGLLKARGLTVVVVLTLAVAIGANTAIFSILQSVLLKPLPYPEDGRIARVAATIFPARANGADRRIPFSDRGYWHFVNNNRSFDKFGGYIARPLQVPLTGDGISLQIEVGRMTLSTFDVLGVLPELGRLPRPEEDAPGGSQVALLSHDLWVTQYRSDPSILGRIVQLNGTPREVIGIMPARYSFPTSNVDVWTPLQLDPASPNFAGHYLAAIARLSPGVTMEGGTADAQSLIAGFSEVGYGPNWFEILDGGASLRPLREEIVGDIRQPLLIVLGTAGFLLLIACSNVANLLLVRTEDRRHENAVRMALGSSRGRLAGHMLVESMLLALMGGAAGVALAYAGIRALVSIAPAAIPRLNEIGVDSRALAFAVLVSLGAGLLFGVLPALRASSTRAMAALRDGGRTSLGRGRHRARNALVVTQIALAFVLVIGSGLMIRTFYELRSVDPGFTGDGVLTFKVQPLATKYGDASAVAALYDQLIERLQGVSGVTGAGAINSLPLTDGGDAFPVRIDEFPPAEGQFPPNFDIRRATPGYFESMGIPVVEGRAFTPDDHNRPLPSTIISESVKARYWPNTSAIGKQISVGGARPIRAQVVGVVGDVHDTGLGVPPEQFFYLPIIDSTGGGVRAMTVTVRTAVEPLSTVNAIRGVIAELDTELPMAEVRSMDRVLGDSLSRTSFTMSLLVTAGLIALFLGSVGIYGVLSYVVRQRAPEVGVRLALGASPSAVRRMVLSQGIRLVGSGVLIGFLAAVALGRVMLGQLYGVNPIDPITLVVVAAVFLAVAIVASVLPATRAAMAPPVETLRAS